MSRSYVQSTSSNLRITQNLSTTTTVTKPLLPLDSTSYLKTVNDYVPLFGSLPVTPSLAYSLRRLNTNYTGNLVKLRRSSDNAELDFTYVAITGLIDVAAIVAWAAGSNTHVVTWYDQSGGGRNITQVTAGSQPRLVAAGDSDTNNKPYVYLGEAASRKLTGTFNMNAITSSMISLVIAPVGTQTGGTNNMNNMSIYWPENNSWGGIGLGVYSATCSWRFGTGQTSNSNQVSRASTNNSLVAAALVKRTTTEAVYINQVQQGATAVGKLALVANNASTYEVGGGDSSGVQNARVCEMLVFSDAPAGLEDTVAASQRSFFSI